MFLVSIPYGTIKSLVTCKDFYNFYVSIPYGTIKSVYCPLYLFFCRLFQFLMVQLKGSGKSDTTTSN